MTLPANPELYTHDPKTGRTVISATIPHAGKYEIWAWPDYVNYTECGQNKQAKGSGEVTVTVGQGTGHGKGDALRECELRDYQMEMQGRWISLGHIREKYRSLSWVVAHTMRSGELL
jgi:hypothetical protein